VIEIVRESRIDAPVEAVWKIVSDPDLAPDWFTFAERVEIRSGQGGGQLRTQHGRWGSKRSEVDQEITHFARSSQGVGADAFGLLPGARAAHGAYLEKAEEALRGLRAVQVTLTADLAGGLRTTAANYFAADEDSMPRSP